MPRSRWILLMLAGAIIGIGTVAGRASRLSPRAYEERGDVLTESAPAGGAGTAQEESPSNETAFPVSGPEAGPVVSAPSLMGTRVDGALETDASGHFVSTASAVRLFDYFLSAEGEIPDGDLRRNVQREAEHRLPPGEVAHAMALFDRYVGYRGRAASRMADVADRRAALAAMHRAREESFGAEDAERMFGEAETIAAAAINESEISTSDIPEDERARRIGEQEENLPRWLQAIHARRALDVDELQWRRASLGR